MRYTAMIPDPPTQSERLREDAARLRTTAQRFEFLVAQALFAWNLLPEFYRAPEADLLHVSLAKTRPAAGEITDGLAAASRAVERFAEEIDDLARHRALVLDRRDAGPPTDLWDERVEGPAAAVNAQRRDEWATDLARDTDRLAEAYDEASRRCAQALGAIPDVAWTSLAAWGGSEVSDAPGSLADAAGLALLSRLASAPDPRRLMSEHADWVTLIRGTDPARVAEWWARLDSDVARSLVAAMPLLLGNLDGVGIRDRVEANRLRADEHLHTLRRQREELRRQRVPARRATAMEVVERRTELRRLEREIAYFEKVQDGSRMLYAWDPERGALIEMSGDPSSAKAALFVVPGTNTDADAFMKEEPVTRFAEWQVQAGGGSVLAFTVMTGPMPQLDGTFLHAGPEWNSMAEDRGPEYARFLQGIEAVKPDLWTMSYEHSYGGGVGSEAEKHGGTVDTRFLAASVGAIGPYEPNPDTAYFATQAPDDINRYYAGIGLGAVGFTVAPETIPGVQIVDSGIPGFDPVTVSLSVLTNGPEYLTDMISRSVGHHSVLMSDDESVNGKVLNQVKEMLAGGGEE